jgi:hypothetical protein
MKVKLQVLPQIHVKRLTADLSSFPCPPFVPALFSPDSLPSF